jgi:hypothetical protein
MVDRFERPIRLAEVEGSYSDEPNQLGCVLVRQQWAVHESLVDEEVNPRVVMAIGGWDSFAAIEPYLTEPTGDVIDDAFSERRDDRRLPSSSYR